jgi:hypothetical protein
MGGSAFGLTQIKPGSGTPRFKKHADIHHPVDEFGD